MSTNTRLETRCGLGLAAVAVVMMGFVLTRPPASSARAEAAAPAAVTTTAPEPIKNGPVAYDLADLVGSFVTRDGGDYYEVEDLDSEGSGVSFTGAASNSGTNSRRIYSTNDVAVTTNQISCATWSGVVDQWVQPGITMRYRTDGARVRAITVTNNVWGNARFLWNVHVWDTGVDGLDTAPDAPIPARSPGHMRVDGFMSDPLVVPETPWRMCGRVEGTTLDFKVWSTTQPEPSWDDPAFGGSVELNPEDVYPGRPGFYIGHLAPGAVNTVTDVTVETIN